MQPLSARTDTKEDEYGEVSYLDKVIQRLAVRMHINGNQSDEVN